MRKLVFLGGTCGNNNWRQGFIRRMMARGFPRSYFFSPVVRNWDDAARRKEDAIKRQATYILFFIGDPMEPGNPRSYYSSVEAVMAQYDSGKCVAVFDLKHLQGHARKSTEKAMRDLQGRFPYAPIFTELSEAENWLARHLRS